MKTEHYKKVVEQLNIQILQDKQFSTRKIQKLESERVVQLTAWSFFLAKFLKTCDICSRKRLIYHKDR